MHICPHLWHITHAHVTHTHYMGQLLPAIVSLPLRVTHTHMHTVHVCMLHVFAMHTHARIPMSTAYLQSVTLSCFVLHLIVK